jgi:toxin FitB
VYLLDTNVVSKLRRPKPHGAVVAWIENVDNKDLFISAVTVGETQAGIEITRDQDLEKLIGLSSGLIDPIAIFALAYKV